jgi:hypothetical protein
MTAALSARQIRMLAAIGRRGTVLLLDPEVLGPWAVETRAALERRGLIERSADGWGIGITSAGRRWLRGMGT